MQEIINKIKLYVINSILKKIIGGNGMKFLDGYKTAIGIVLCTACAILQVIWNIELPAIVWTISASFLGIGLSDKAIKITADAQDIKNTLESIKK